MVPFRYDPFIFRLDHIRFVCRAVPADHAAVRGILDDVFDRPAFKCLAMGRFAAEAVQLPGNVKESLVLVDIHIKHASDDFGFFRNDHRRLFLGFDAVAKWRACLITAAESFFGHPSCHFAGEPHRVILIHPFNNTLDQTAKRSVYDRLRYAHNVHAALFTKQGLVYDAFFLVPCKS